MFGGQTEKSCLHVLTFYRKHSGQKQNTYIRRWIKIEYEKPSATRSPPTFSVHIHVKRRKYSLDPFTILHRVSVPWWRFNQPYFCGVPARSKSVMPGEGNPGSGSLRSPRSMERPLKAGWLKKQQRGLVKNWHQRYYVLRGSTLTQHKDDKETTVQVRCKYINTTCYSSTWICKGVGVWCKLCLKYGYPLQPQMV